MQTLQKKYIDQLCLDRKVAHLSGWKFVCPFCSHMQKSDHKRNEKCATLLDVYDSGGYAYTFHCARGINNSTLYPDCGYAMSFTQFLRSHNPALCDRYLKEKNKCEIRRRRKKIPKDFSDGKYPNRLNHSPATRRKDLVEVHKERVVTITADDGNTVSFTSSTDEEMFRRLMILVENLAN
jgi:hypothetical protein